MRELKTKDFMKVVMILGKIIAKSKSSLTVSENNTVNATELGMTFVSAATEYAETDLKELLASIAEMDLETFEAQPFDFPLDVIEHLAEKEDLQGFLQRAMQLAKKFSKNPSTESQADTVGP